MSKSSSEKPAKLGGDQKRKADRKAAKTAAKLAAAEAAAPAAPADPVQAKKDSKDKADKAVRKEEKAARKEKKEAKRRAVEERHPAPETATTTETAETPAAPTDAPESPSKKRKRDGEDGDLEIDIMLPQPVSKKSLRKIKKHPELAAKIIKPSAAAPKEVFPEHASQSRTKFGVWIGNLSFQTSPATLEDFFVGERSGLDKEELHRINLPLDARTGRNKGFAYVDFKTEAGLAHALTLNEELVGGRRVLIKSSHDFSNRPAPAADTAAVGGTPAARTGANAGKNPPSRILYVGNLEFSCTAEHVKEHFAFAGRIQKVRMATFEDTGKCKGFAFVDFDDQESVARAMSGLTAAEEEARKTSEGKAELELASVRRRRGILGARPLTLEYGQDPSVRYKKRFGGKEREEGAEAGIFEKKPRVWKDTRSTDAGAAYSSDVRRTGAITAGEGKKMTFE